MCNKARLTLKTLYMPPHIAARRTRKLENEMEKSKGEEEGKEEGEEF